MLKLELKKVLVVGDGYILTYLLRALKREHFTALGSQQRRR